MMLLNEINNVQISVLTVFLFLFIVHFIVILKNKISPRQNCAELKLRIKSWWLITFLISLAVIGNKLIGFIFVGFISFLALKEYISLIPTRRADRRVLLWAYLAIPAQLYFLSVNWLEMFYLFVPLYMFLAIPMRMIFVGENKGFIKSVGTIHWGLMATTYSIGYLAAFLIVPKSLNPIAGGVGLLLFLLIINSINDVAQYVFGKTFGKRKIIPKISPKKTYEGFFGGIFSAIVLSILIAPYLTPLNNSQAFCAGLIISVSGFIGDIVLSALKRDMGVKDSSTLIPGHGGILDRIDSLIYTAPLFFHFTMYLYA